MLIKWIRGLVNNSELLTKSYYLLDKQDRKHFVKFLCLLMIAGLVSLFLLLIY